MQRTTVQVVHLTSPTLKGSEKTRRKKGGKEVQEPDDQFIYCLLYKTFEIQQDGCLTPEQCQSQLTCQYEWGKSHKAYPWMKRYTQLMAAKREGGMNYLIPSSHA